MPVLCLRLVQSFVNFATNSAHHRLHSITAPDLLRSCLPLISVLGGPKKQFGVGWFWVGPCLKRSRMPQPSFKSKALKAWRSNIRLSILEAGNMIPGLRQRGACMGAAYNALQDVQRSCSLCCKCASWVSASCFSACERRRPFSSISRRTAENLLPYDPHGNCPPPYSLRP